MTRLRTILLILISTFPFTGIAAQGNTDEIVQTLFDTTFDEKNEHVDWRVERNGQAVVKEQLLFLEARQGLPEFSRPADFIGGEFRLIVELRTGTESSATLFWTSRGSFRRDENNTVTLPLNDDGDWRTYEFVFTVPDILTNMMFRFSAPDGSWEIRSIKLIRTCAPPLSIKEAVPYLHQEEGKPDREMYRFIVANNVLVPMTYRIGNQTEERTLPRDETVALGVPIRTEGNLAAVGLTLHPKGFPSVVAPIFVYRPEGNTKWIQKPLGNDQIIEIAPDARMARLRQNDELIGIIAPLVHRNGIIPQFVLADDSTETELHFESSDVDLRINIAPPFVNLEITDKLQQEESEPLEGPAIRLFGTLRSGLLPGVEFLKTGDVSSAEIDIESPWNDRSKPNPFWITMPLAVLETDKGGAALYWEDTNLQPTFSVPNRFDHTDDHRVSLIGSHIKASLEILSPTPPPEKQPQAESAAFRVLRSYIARKGFPAPPTARRSGEEQQQLTMLALTNALQSEMGGQWGYAFEPQWERKPFADILSTSARLTEAAGGRFKNPNALVFGGADISNDAVFFLSGRIPEWQRNRESAIRQIRAMVNADGSFLYRTRFPEWETAASSFGYTALQALVLMEYVRLTGNDELFVMVTKALDYLEQCEIPSGGFYRDTPFHTPDLQTAATLIWLYTWAYEYNGNTDYLERAKHFAFAGLPFVYQTASQEKEHMLYGTVGKFGGEHRQLPLHCGLLTTRVGIQYAYALNVLAQYDKQTNWKTAALGILQATENLQYTEGLEAGCVPELFDVINQERRGWKVNPCALVSLRWAVEGKVDSLFVLKDGKDRYAAPYPLRKTPKGIEAYNVPPGQRFNILLNGSRYGRGEGNGLITVD